MELQDWLQQYQLNDKVYMYSEYQVVKSIKYLDGVPIGSIGTVLIIYEEGDYLEIEFVDSNGDTLNVLTVHRDDIKPVEI